MYKLFKGVSDLPRSTKRVILIIVDCAVLIGALWLSFSLSLDDWYWPRGGLNNHIVLLVLFAPGLAVPIFSKFGLYRAIVRYIGIKAVWSLVKAVSSYAALWGLLVFLSGVEGVPRSVVLINAMVALLTVGGSRMFARWLLRKTEEFIRFSSTDHSHSRVIIFGAGAAGRALSIGLVQTQEFVLMAFVDDNVLLQGRDLMGVRILSQEDLRIFLTVQKVDDIMLAIPSITHKERNLIIERLRPFNLRVRTLPGLLDLARGQVHYSNLQELEVNDLLAREPAEPDEKMLLDQVKNKKIMVTGAGGSIGSELCWQILRRKPKVLLLLELNEFALYTLHNRLLDCLHHLTHEGFYSDDIEIAPSIIPLMGSVTDENRVSDIILTWQPDTIYHAAAVKHVPIVEQNVAECVKTNVLGTMVMAKVAIEREVESFILISTDKAVNPTNAMGASKRCCEMILQALSFESTLSFEHFSGGIGSAQVTLNTQFSIVRFGNVLGSSGSVVPQFRKQIRQGGPITLTHQDIIRYFMTIPEAAQLVMQTGSMAGVGSQGISAVRRQRSIKSAEVYVLDMGDPVKIIDLAHRMVELSGFRVKDENTPEGDIAIEMVGLRPGEKLYEELLIGNNPQTTEHPRIMKANEKFLPWSQLQPMITTLRIAAVNGDVLMILSMLQQLVPEYQPDQNVVDWVYKEQIAQADRLEF